MSNNINAELANLIGTVNRYEPASHAGLHHVLGEYLYALPSAEAWTQYTDERDRSFTGVGLARAQAAVSVTGPPCPECDEDLTWVESVDGGVRRDRGECSVCDDVVVVTA